MREIPGLGRFAAWVSIALFSALTLPTGSVLGEDVSEPLESVFELEYKPDGLIRVTTRPSFKGAIFEKEPDFGERNVVRGLIPTGTVEKEHVGFIWDRAEGKLYLDLNRNRDLTDDPNGVFQNTSISRFQDFRNIHLQVPLDSVRLPFVLQMSIYDSGGGRPNCYVSVLSGFSGEIELYGKKWHMAIADNMDGELGPGDRFVLTPLGPDYFRSDFGVFSLPAPKTIFFGGHNYDVSFDFEPGETQPLMRAAFRETEPPMGRLDIDGKFIKRLVLRDGSSLVLLDSPEPNVPIPAGAYSCRSVYLDGGEAGLFRPEYFPIPPVSIRKNESATLRIGGPLNHTIEVERNAGVFTLNYKLVGVGGLSYGPLLRSSENPPTFTVYKGNKQIASGEFEYG
ncbi:MAG: hypothetical protein ACYS6W_09700 [Planctomycetota bacterium]|jgi:hypothetical protein